MQTQFRTKAAPLYSQGSPPAHQDLNFGVLTNCYSEMSGILNAYTCIILGCLKWRRRPRPLQAAS